jgi:hypothetical protein
VETGATSGGVSGAASVGVTGATSGGVTGAASVGVTGATSGGVTGATSGGVTGATSGRVTGATSGGVSGRSSQVNAKFTVRKVHSLGGVGCDWSIFWKTSGTFLRMKVLCGCDHRRFLIQIRILTNNVVSGSGIGINSDPGSGMFIFTIQYYNIYTSNYQLLFSSDLIDIY